MRSLLLAALLVQVPVPQVDQEPRVGVQAVPALVEHRSDNALRDRLVRAMDVWHDAGDFLVGSAQPGLIEGLAQDGVAGRQLSGIGPDDELFVIDLTQVDVPAMLGESARLVDAVGAQGLVAVPAGKASRSADLAPGQALHVGVARVRRQAWALPPPVDRLALLQLQAKAGANDPRIDALVAAASKTGLQADVQMLSANHSRNSTVASWIDAARDQIAGRLATMGYAPQFVTFLANHGDNIQVEIPGAVAPDEWIVIGAHYDSYTSAGWNANAPGADDNASGSAGVLEIARVLAAAGPFERSIRLIWFAGEEYGLYGSQAAAQASLAAGEEIIGMLNLDMTAYRGANDKRDVDFVTNGTSTQLTELCAALGAQYVPGWAAKQGLLLGGNSDHSSYTQAGYASVFPFEDVSQHSPYIHSASDTYPLSTPDFDLALMITRGVLATAAVLAEPADLVITHTPLPDTTNAAGPYAVTAQVTSLVGTAVSSVALHYSTDGSSFVSVPMAASGADWTASIPGQASPATIGYYITALDSLGQDETLPNGADLSLEPFAFFVGVRNVLYANGFEGAGDDGWTHAALVGQDDWKRGAPGGRSGDPAQAFEGQRVWGNDLGLGGADGAYASGLEDWLRSPSFDCSTASNVTLSFRRWLTVDAAMFDQAQLLVNGQLIWQNPSGTPLIDTGWVPVTIDISSLAAGNPSVRIEFRLHANEALSFGGWNLDAFELSERSPGSGGCLPPLSYCTPKLNSRLCLPVIESNGTPSATSPEPFLVNAVDVINNKAGVLFYGSGPSAKPYQGGTLCVQGPVKRTAVQDSAGNPPPDDCSGSYSFDFNALIQAGGDPALLQGALVCCQYWYRDPGDFAGFGSGLTDALSFTVCP